MDLYTHIYEEWMIVIVCAFILMLYFIITWYLKVTTGRCNSTANLSGQVAIITGANQGIGYHTALDLATRNCRVILACRDTEKGETAANTIRNETGNKNVIVRKLDLSSMKSVRDFVSNFVDNEYRLDILINNAGVLGLPYSKTEDGLEKMYATNYFGPFLLTNLLLDLMKKSKPSRIINVTSLVYSWGKIEFDNLSAEKKFSKYSIYYNTKLANVMFTKELSKHLKGTGVTANCVHPGTVSTNLLGNCPWILKLFYYTFVYLFCKTAEDGAQTSINCAVAEELKDVSGEYFVDCKVTNLAACANDEAASKKLWELSEKLTGLR